MEGLKTGRVREGMKKQRRKGFTLVEVIIVLIIIGILAAIAVPKFTGSEKGAILASMKEDAKNAIGVEQAYYLAYQEYGALSGTLDGGDNGATANLGGDSKFKIVASPHNQITITNNDCSDGSKGFQITVTNSNADKQYTFDSCTDASIREEDVSGS